MKFPHERWRVGRRLGRTIYRQVGPQPSDSDYLIGIMDAVDDAAEVVRCVNLMHEIEAHGRAIQRDIDG